MIFSRIPCIVLALAIATGHGTHAANLRSSATPNTNESKQSDPVHNLAPMHADYSHLLNNIVPDTNMQDPPMHADYSHLLEMVVQDFEGSEDAKEFADLHHDFLTNEAILGLTKPSTYLKAVKFPGIAELTDEMCDDMDAFYGAVVEPSNRKLYDEEAVMALSGCQNHVCTVPLNLVMRPALAVGNVVSSALILKLALILAPFTGGASGGLAALAVVGIQAGTVITTELLAKLIDHVCCEL